MVSEQACPGQPAVCRLKKDDGLRIPEDVVLVLAGGNALGAYQAGAYEAMHERGMEPTWVIGASIGSINGAIIAGNRREQRIAKLREFWRLAQQFSNADPSERRTGRRSSRTGKTLWANQTFMTGRPGIFAPRLLSLWSALPGMPDDVSLFDTAPLLATLHQCVDFDQLNGGAVRLTATAVDVESGEDVFFDTARTEIGAEHLRASAAFPVLYPPVHIDGRVLVDSAVSANLPLRALSSELPELDTVCLAIDLFARAGPPPRSLGDALKRGQDLLFANQAKHAIEDLRTATRLRKAERLLAGKAAGAGSGDEPAGPPSHRSEGALTLLHVIYSEAGQESAAKMLDYSEASVQERWAAGYRDVSEGLAQVAAMDSPPAGAFSAFRLESSTVHSIG